MSWREPTWLVCWVMAAAAALAGVSEAVTTIRASELDETPRVRALQPAPGELYQRFVVQSYDADTVEIPVIGRCMVVYVSSYPTTDGVDLPEPAPEIVPDGLPPLPDQLAYKLVLHREAVAPELPNATGVLYAKDAAFVLPVGEGPTTVERIIPFACTNPAHNAVRVTVTAEPGNEFSEGQ